jgi:hypothetical protein
VMLIDIEFAFIIDSQLKLGFVAFDSKRVTFEYK